MYVEALREKRQAVLSEIEKLRAQAAALAAQLGTRETQLHNIDELLELENQPRASVALGVTRTTTTTRANRFIDAAYDALDRGREPIHYRELARVLAEAGVYVPGQDPAANLLSHMSRDLRFARAKGRGVYGLAEWPTVKDTPRKRTGRPAPARGRR